MKDPLFIKGMLQRGKEAGEKVKTEFPNLSLTQLNWKPAPNSWSIAQCLDHLIVSNSFYFPVFEKISNSTYRMTIWQKWSPLSGLFGKVIGNQTQENVKMKLKTAKVFVPASSQIDSIILDRFQENLGTLLEYIATFNDIDLDKIKITSPVSKFITYNPRNTIKILVPHLHRHINQAMRVKQAKEFPAI